MCPRLTSEDKEERLNMMDLTMEAIRTVKMRGRCKVELVRNCSVFVSLLLKSSLHTRWTFLVHVIQIQARLLDVTF